MNKLIEIIHKNKFTKRRRNKTKTFKWWWCIKDGEKEMVDSEKYARMRFLWSDTKEKFIC